MRRRVVAVLVVLAVLVTGFLLVRPEEPYALAPPAALRGARSAHAFVVSHGWHTGLVIPSAALNARFPALAARFGSPAYYEIGWGDKGFYQAKEVSAALAVRALFWSSGTVVHIVGVAKSPEEEFPASETMRACLTPAQVERLETFVAASIARDAKGSVQRLGPGIYGDSEFYAGVGRYSLVNTCNKWTAKGLQSAGLDVLPPLALTAGGVTFFVKRNAAALACEPTRPE